MKNEAAVDWESSISADNIHVFFSGSWVADGAEIKSQNTEPQQILEEGWVAMSLVLFMLSPSVMMATA